MKSGILVALFTAAVLQAPASNAAKDDDLIPELQSHPCLLEILPVLNDWGSQFHFKRAAPNDGAAIYRSPTNEVGVWTVVSVHGTDVLLHRVGPSGAISVSFDASCARKMNAVAKAPPAGFDDADVKARIAGGKPVVFYAWSPHMPLSVSGLIEMRKAAAELRIPVVAVLDPRAVAAFAKTTAARERFDAGDLEPLASIELLHRGMTIHYPSAVLWSEARGFHDLRLGYEKAPVYRAYLDEELRTAKVKPEPKP